jgi:hypothetical protein
MKIAKRRFDEIELEIIKGKLEGIVISGAGGNLLTWIEGISSILQEEGITKTSEPTDLWSSVFSTTSSGGRIDLVLVFKDKGRPFNMGKLAIWRMRFGKCSWISDWLVNYRDHFITESDFRVNESSKFEKEKHFLELRIEELDGTDIETTVMTYPYVLTGYESSDGYDDNRKRIFKNKEKAEAKKAIALFAKELIKWYSKGKYDPEVQYINIVWGMDGEVLSRWEDFGAYIELNKLVERGIARLNKS